MEREKFDNWMRNRDPYGTDVLGEAWWGNKTPPAPPPPPPPPTRRSGLATDTTIKPKIDAATVSFAQEIGLLDNSGAVPANLKDSGGKRVNPAVTQRTVEAIRRFAASVIMGGEENPINPADVKVILSYLYNTVDGATGKTLADLTQIRTPAMLLSAYKAGFDREAADHVTAGETWNDLERHYGSMHQDELERQRSGNRAPTPTNTPTPPGGGSGPGPTGGPTGPTAPKDVVREAIQNLRAMAPQLFRGRQNQANLRPFLAAIVRLEKMVP